MKDTKNFNGLVVGERYSWDDYVRALPRKWIVVKDYELAEDGGVSNGILIDALDSDNINEFDGYAKEGCICQYTLDTCETEFEVGLANWDACNIEVY